MQESSENEYGTSGGTATECNQNRYRSIISEMDSVTKFSDEWFHLKEQEISLRNILYEGDDNEPPADVLGANNAAEESAHERVLCGRPEVLSDLDVPVPEQAIPPCQLSNEEAERGVSMNKESMSTAVNNTKPTASNTGMPRRLHAKPELIECENQSSTPLPGVYEVVGRDVQAEKKFTGSRGSRTSGLEIIEENTSPSSSVNQYCDIKVKEELKTCDVSTTLTSSPVFVGGNEVPVPLSCIEQRYGVLSITGKSITGVDQELDEIEDKQSPTQYSSSHGFNEDRGSLKSHHSSHRGLVVACPIADDEPVYMASKYVPSPTKTTTTTTTSPYEITRCRIYTLLMLLVVGSGIIVGIVYATGNGVTKRSRREASIRRMIEENVLERNATFSIMRKDDPRYLALKWILYDDRMQLSVTDSNLHQRYILACLAFSFDLYSWRCGIIDDDESCYNMTDDYIEYDPWLLETDECSWYGVECDDDGAITVLDLLYNNLIGEIPPEIAGLRYLNILRLGQNCIHSTLPPEMFTLNLTELNVGWNVHSGSVPSELYKLGSLTRLNLAGNRRNSTCNRTDGTSADFSSSGFEGNILGSDVGNLAKLTELEVYRNSFDGPISAQIRILNNLEILAANSNMFTGSIPDEITELSNVKGLWIGNNKNLTGVVPESIGEMKALETLSLWGTSMSGTIPKSLYNLTHLTTLQLFRNTPGFSGTIATEIGYLVSLEHLDVNDNFLLSGTIPTEIGLFKNLSQIRLHGTQISGTMPSEVCDLTSHKLNLDFAWSEAYFQADCSPNNETLPPFLVCDCCSTCCDHTTKLCLNRETK